MSQIFFSKQDSYEKQSRLSLLGSSQGVVTVWLKGSKDKHNFNVGSFDKEREDIVLQTRENHFSVGQLVLCSFELRGMTFFSEVIFQVSIGGLSVLQFKNTLFKSERRESFRLLTYPMYEVWAEFDLDEVHESSNVIDLKTRSSQTELFKSFLKLVSDENKDTSEGAKLKIRVQDLSTTGIALYVGELEQKFFEKGLVYRSVKIKFPDDVFNIPLVKVVYAVEQISKDNKSRRSKIGLHFENLPTSTDDLISKKITRLLRENDSKKDFEKFIK